MKSSCYFVFNYSVLLCANLYSIHLHNSLRTWSNSPLYSQLLNPPGLFSVTALCPWLRLLSYDWLQTTFTAPYKLSARTKHRKHFHCRVSQTTQKTSHVIAISPDHWRADSCLATSYNHSSYCCVHLSEKFFMAPLPIYTCYNIISLARSYPIIT
jgi:hypothetical protein